VNTPTRKQIVEQAERMPEFVAAPVIARRLSVTGRYILQLAEAGKIPCIRLGRKCVRFSPPAVAAALGISWEGSAK
jgi:excisionase family DNA binding protein